MQHRAIEVIRHSLAAANAALELLEETPADAVETVVEAATEMVAEPVCGHTHSEEVVPSFTKFDYLMGELKHPDYSLRTTNELSEILCMSASSMKQLLNDNNVSWTTRTRRSDGAELLGLTNRN